MNNKEEISFLRDELKAAQKTLEDAQNMVRVLQSLINRYNLQNISTPLPPAIDKFLVLSDYGNASTFPEKVYLALKQITEGTVQEVVDSWMKLDGTITAEKGLGDARFHLSKLYNKGNGVINARLEGKGKRYIYSIK
jgi:hypothetical protein